MLVAPASPDPSRTVDDHGHRGHHEPHGHHEHGGHEHAVHDHASHGAHDHSGHRHDHRHGHVHAQAHSHKHIHATPRQKRAPRMRSLMALSGGQRLVLVLPLLAGLWLATLWAMA